MWLHKSSTPGPLLYHSPSGLRERQYVSALGQTGKNRLQLTGKQHALLYAGQAALIDSRCSSSYFTGGGSFI